MDDALANLINEATAVYETQFAIEGEAYASSGYEAEQFLEQHFAPLIYESESLFDALAADLGPRDARTMMEAEIETAVDRHQPAAELSPTFEDFFGKLKKAVKSVAKKAVSVAKKGISVAAKLGLGPVLNKLKGLVKPLLKRVIKTAIRKLPRPLRPLASKLARRLPFLREIEELDMESEALDDMSEVAEMQYEFNQQMANLLFAANEIEQDLEIAEIMREQEAPSRDPIDDLDRAREQFIAELEGLQDDEDPTPYVENFVPAILPALRLGIKLAGRQRVVNFIAGFVARMIRRFVGRRYARPLSRAIVDAGLRLISLEVTAEDEERAAASAVAATVEETVRRVAALPDYILDDQELLEGFAMEAFELAAGENLPQMLSEEVYRKRPDLGKGRKFRGVWVMRPGQRGRRNRKQYKKYSRKIPCRMTPHKLRNLKSFKGMTVKEFLEEQHGLEPGEEFEAVVHLYESMPGTRLADIARLDEDAPDMGSSEADVPLHPLSREAAALLLDEPQMGVESEDATLDPHAINPGQRFYYLEIPGKRPLTTPGRNGRPKRRRTSRSHLVLDFPKNEIRFYLYMSEVAAQKIAARLRRRQHAGPVIVRLRRVVRRAVHNGFRGTYGRLKLIHESITPDKRRGAMRRMPPAARKLYQNQVTRWLVKALAAHMKQQPETFIKAAQDTADGLTIQVTISSPPGFSQLRQVLKGKNGALAGMKSDSTPATKIMISAGYQRE